MRTKIFYFSGTGNSLFIAKKLQESIADSELIPIVKALKNSVQKTYAERIVFVFPVYALTIPLPVREFLRTCDFDGARYFCAVATRLGLYFNDFRRIDKLIKPAKLNSHFILNMGNNDIKVKNYRCPSADEIKELEIAALGKIEKISNLINSCEDSREKDSDYLEKLPFDDFRDNIISWFVPKLMTFSKIIGGVNYYYTNSKCNGCGICSRVCLSGKISMNNKQPVWNKKTLCHMCYACVNYCPVKAVEIDSIPGVPSYSYENGRYSHPYAGYRDIINQKE